MNIGSHISISKGYYNAVKETNSIGGNTFQFFSRNPRGGKAKEIDLEDIGKAKLLMEKHNVHSILAHAPYTMNLASAKEDVAIFAKSMMIDDLNRMKMIPCNLYNFHPGSHIGLGVEKGTEKIVGALNDVTGINEKVYILLETMAGKGTEIGRSFEELKNIIDGVKNNKMIGVCLDTCHIYSAGYDIVNNLDGVVEEFDRVIGIERLKAIHLNDSMKDFESFKDRHEKIGKGTIGLNTIINVINHPKLRHLPFLLETPNELDGYKSEIEMLKAAYIKK